MNNAHTVLVTLNVTGFWQPTERATGKTAEFRALRSCYVVDCFTAYEHDCQVTTFTGVWDTEDKAKEYARSCGDARVRYVTPYWYVPGFGPVKVKGSRGCDQAVAATTVAA